MNAEKVHLAEAIDTWVLSVLNQGGGDEQILEMHAYMDTFKQLLDTCTRLKMTLLAQRYDRFYLRQLAGTSWPRPSPTASSRFPGRQLPDSQDKTQEPRLLKPRPKRQAAKQQQIRHAIDMLPFFTEMILGTLQNTEEEHALLPGSQTQTPCAG
ncbi:MAG: hypothetical protein IPK53_10840 [bacterium]|nr:hypothetical protein [bacterium]